MAVTQTQTQEWVNELIGSLTFFGFKVTHDKENRIISVKGKPNLVSKFGKQFFISFVHNKTELSYSEYDDMAVFEISTINKDGSGVLLKHIKVDKTESFGIWLTSSELNIKY
jgi:hypothetical protein